MSYVNQVDGLLLAVVASTNSTSTYLERKISVIFYYSSSRAVLFSKI